MVEKNDSSKEIKTDTQSKSSNTPIPIVLENCEGTQDNNLVTIVTFSQLSPATVEANRRMLF